MPIKRRKWDISVDGLVNISSQSTIQALILHCNKSKVADIVVKGFSFKKVYERN